MKKFLALALSTVMVFGLAACGSSSSSQESAPAADSSAEAEAPAVEAAPDEVFELNISHIVDENNTWHKASLKFKEIVEEESEGRITVNVYPNSTLGTEIEAIQSILTQGGCDITMTAESMQTYAEELGIMGMPYAFESMEHLQAVLDSDVGADLEQIMIDAGLRPLGAFVRGARNITSNKEITTPADLAGFVIRTPESPMTVAAFQAMGAKPTPMAFAEVFTALQQGTIDGQENPLAMIQSGAFYEVQDYVIMTEHLISCVYFAIGEAKFQSMPADLQQIVLDAGDAAIAYEHELFLEEEEVLKQSFIDAGMTFVEVDKEPFIEAAVSGVIPVLTEKQAALYERIKQVEY